MCASVHRPAGPEARDRVLTADEIRSFWRASESVDAPLAPGAPRPFGPLLKVLLLTGQRRNEVAGMTRDELSDDGLGTFRAAERKMVGHTSCRSRRRCAS